MRAGASTWRMRAAFALVLACALIVRLGVPGGWMPVVTADGVRLMLCPSAAPAPTPKAAMAHHGGHGAAAPHHEPDRPDHPERPCAFASVAAAMAEPVAPALAVPAVVAVAAPIALPPALTPGRGLAAPPPPATGPPLLV